VGIGRDSELSRRYTIDQGAGTDSLDKCRVRADDRKSDECSTDRKHAETVEIRIVIDVVDTRLSQQIVTQAFTMCKICGTTPSGLYC
jgi:hypothetical protein